MALSTGFLLPSDLPKWVGMAEPGSPTKALTCGSMLIEKLGMPSSEPAALPEDELPLVEELPSVVVTVVLVELQAVT